MDGATMMMIVIMMSRRQISRITRERRKKERRERGQQIVRFQDRCITDLSERKVVTSLQAFYTMLTLVDDASRLACRQLMTKEDSLPLMIRPPPRS